MEAVLKHVNAVPGVVGSMVCDHDGQMAAGAFPQLFDGSMLHEAAAVLAESAFGLQSGTGGVELLDLRYADARIIVRPMQQAFLFLLCTKAVNLQLLSLSVNVAIKKLEKLLATRTQASLAAPAVPTAPAAGLPLPAAPADARERVRPDAAGKGVVLTVQAMKNTANTYWDNMLEMVSLNRSTSILISDHFKTGSFKKLKLTNPRNGNSRKFPVHVIKDDAERLFEGKVVVSLASMESLGVRPGDAVTAEIEIGGGLFGWEGI